MIARFVCWLLSLLRRERFDIGRFGDTYLVRWTLLGKRFEGTRRIFLHRFLRGDADADLHCHPWNFVSVILSGGYYEQTPSGTFWRGPGSVLFRPANWRHRVIVPDGCECWTLVMVGPKRKSWYFHCSSGPVPWRQYIGRAEVGLAGCGETS